MNQPTRIACVAAIHVGQLLVAAIVLNIAYEAGTWFLMWNESRRSQ